MNILLDTSIALWVAADEGELSPLAIDIIEDTRNILYVSAAAIQEIAIKHDRGELDVHPRLARAAFKAVGLIELPIAGEHAEMISMLPRFADHADLFDRTMVAQALAESMHLMTADSRFVRYHASLIIQV